MGALQNIWHKPDHFVRRQLGRLWRYFSAGLRHLSEELGPVGSVRGVRCFYFRLFVFAFHICRQLQLRGPYSEETTHGMLFMFLTLLAAAAWQRGRSGPAAFALGTCGGIAAVQLRARSLLRF